MKPKISMREALEDPNIFGDILPGDSWLPWRVLLIAMMGEPLTDEERVVFTRLTMREREPLMRVEEFWGIVGRRGGKTRAMSVLSAYLAGLCDWRDVLVPGEHGRLFYLAHTQKQARLAFDYAKSIFQERPLFAAMVRNVTDEVIALNNCIELEVRAATWRGLRGVTSIGTIFDELAFFMSEEHSSNTDHEILNAVRPSLATTGGPIIAISSPYAKRGEVFQTVERDFGPKGDPLILVARGASRDLNPSLPQRVVDKALERDPAAARAEYLGQFRDDLAAFVSVETVTECIRTGIAARPPNRTHLPYYAFVDPSGGRSDAMTLGIAHFEERHDCAVLDLIDEVKPPFAPASVVARFAETMLAYGCTSVTGDAYGAEWVAEAFKQHSITYRKSKLNKSEIFLNFLPLMNSGNVQLLDHQRMVAQLVGLQRRVTGGGREVIDHTAGGHDDIANSVAGALVLAAQRRHKPRTTTGTWKAF